MKLDRNRRGQLVCFVGIDGSGKSTLARALTAIVEKQGIECHYVWGGFSSSFIIFKPLIGALKASLFSGNGHMEVSKTKGRVLKSSRLSALYQYLALTDYTIQALFKIRLPLSFGRQVVCDRYVYDLITSIGVLLDYPMDKTLALLSRCLAFLPKPDLVFLVDLPETVAYHRKDDIVSPEFLSIRRKIYLRMAQHEGMTILDGNRNPAELQQLVATKALPLITGEA
jgi:thymidylate kinase